MTYRKKRVICLVLAMLLAMLGTWSIFKTRESRVQKNLAKEVFRFHVIANSNSEKDQALKMKVKEKVIAYMEQELPESDSVKRTREWAVSHMQEIEQIAKQALQEESCEHVVRGSVVNCYFPDKTYGDVFQKVIMTHCVLKSGRQKAKIGGVYCIPICVFWMQFMQWFPMKGKKN